MAIDLKSIVSYSTGTTADFKTGSWSSKKPFYAEKMSPCREACPAGNDIAGMLALASQGDFNGGLALLLRENPLPGVCGRVCYQPCRLNCNRAQFDDAVEIRSLERALADFGQAEPSMWATGAASRVAVIGAGPAGLSAAYFLARLGHRVTIFERHAKPGGVLRYGIPAYRLPKDILDREIGRVLSLGVELRCGASVDQSFLRGLRSQFDALFLSTGAWMPRTMGMELQARSDIAFGLDFLSQAGQQEICRHKKRVVVIGGGDVAVDVARTTLRLCGPDASVTMVAPEPKGEWPAIREGLAEAEEEGIKLVGGFRPVEFPKGTLKSLKFVPTKVQRDSATGIYQMLPAPGSDLILDADLAIIAIGQVPDLSPFDREVLDRDSAHVYVDAFGMTPLEDVYAGGDLVRQRPAVVDAIAAGKRGALSIHLTAKGAAREAAIESLRIGGGSPVSFHALVEPNTSAGLRRVVPYGELNTLTYRKSARQEGKTRAVAIRSHDFDEVSFGLDREAAAREAARCFFCGHCVECDLCYLLCPDVSIRKESPRGYRVEAEYCKGCGVCATSCPRDVIEMRDAR
jgi:NADPH-dependent glutamate synthase beta subunit-like oxidoreductase